MNGGEIWWAKLRCSAKKWLQVPRHQVDSSQSLISLWRSDGKPYFGHDRACSRENLEPQSQEAGMRGGGQS